MTDKQMLFVEEYLKSLNGTEAYMAVYTHVKNRNSAKVNASRLLARPDIRAFVDKKLQEMHDEKTADAKEVLEYLTSVMRGETQSEVVTVVGIGDGLSEARNVLKAPEERDRLKAAELLGKRYRLFTEKVDLEAEVGVVIVDDITEES